MGNIIAVFGIDKYDIMKYNQSNKQSIIEKENVYGR